jgi:hypothetical protein
MRNLSSGIVSLAQKGTIRARAGAQETAPEVPVPNNDRGRLPPEPFVSSGTPIMLSGMLSLDPATPATNPDVPSA